MPELKQIKLTAARECNGVPWKRGDVLTVDAVRYERMIELGLGVDPYAEEATSEPAEEPKARRRKRAADAADEPAAAEGEEG